MMASLPVKQISSKKMKGNRPWCARLSLAKRGGVSREFIDAVIEWGPPRVHYFILPEGAYEVYEPTSIADGKRYLVISRDGDTHVSDMSEVIQCLSGC